MANYSRWDDVKGKRPAPPAEGRAGIKQDLALGQLIYDLRTDAGLSQRELAERWVPPSQSYPASRKAAAPATALTPSPGSPPR